MTDRKKALEAVLAKVEAGEADDLTAFYKAPPLPTPFMISARLAYRGSLNAARDMHEAVLPDRTWLIRAIDEDDIDFNGDLKGKYLANIWHSLESPNRGDDSFSAWCDTPARAWLCAILKALIAQEDH